MEKERATESKTERHHMKKEHEIKHKRERGRALKVRTLKDNRDREETLREWQQVSDRQKQTCFQNTLLELATVRGIMQRTHHW